MRTRNANLTTFLTLLLLTLTFLIAATPTGEPNPGPAEPENATPDEHEVTSKTFPLDVPLYTLSQDGRTVEPFNETVATGTLYCETSNASPWVWDVERASQHLQGRRKWCWQGNPGGSKCTTHITHGTAAIGLCGSLLLGLECRHLAWVGFEVLNNCRNGDRAGGSFVYSERLKGIVF